MKRWIAGILALLMAVVFTACGNSGAETPDTKDPADIARDIATAEVLGDTLATAYENGLPMAEDWLDLYFMGSSIRGQNAVPRLKRSIPPTRNYCTASAQPMQMLLAGMIFGMRCIVTFGGATISMRVTTTAAETPK